MTRFILVITAISGLEYYGLYLKVDGVENVATFVIYAFSIILLISSYSSFDDKKESKNKNKNKPNKFIIYMFKIWWWLMILGYIYIGYFLIGAMWILSTLLLIASNKKDKKEV